MPVPTALYRYFATSGRLKASYFDRRHILLDKGVCLDSVALKLFGSCLAHNYCLQTQLSRIANACLAGQRPISSSVRPRVGGPKHPTANAAISILTLMSAKAPGLPNFLEKNATRKLLKIVERRLKE